MKQTFRIVLCLLLSVVSMAGVFAADKVNGLWISPAPGNDFDASTVWYRISNYKSGGTYCYLSTASGYVESPYVLKLSNQTKDATDAGLWCITADDDGGYRFYNKGLGTGYVLSTANASKGAMVAEGTATATNFTFVQGSNVAGVSGWFIKDGTSGNNYWNQQGGYLAHWNSSGAMGDNNSTFTFELVGDAPEDPEEPELSVFSESADNAVFHVIKFKAGSVYISEGTKVGDLLITKSGIDALWALIGNAESFKLMSKRGHYVGVKTTTNDFCYTVSSASAATNFTLISNADGSFEIARKGQTGTTFNPWGGMSADRNIGFWSAGDNSNKLMLINEADLPVLDYNTVTGGQRPADISPLSLWYDFPATLSGVGNPWMEYGLPIGNGQVGATLLGGVLQDEMVLNEKTLYNGSPTDWGEHGKYACLGKILVDDLSEMASVKDDSKPISDYVRYLDIEQGVAGVRFSNAAGTHFTRQYLASAPHKVLAAHYKAEGDEKLHLRFSYAPDEFINASSVTYKDNSATFGGKLKTVYYSTEMRVVATGGTVTATAKGLEVEGASEVTLYMTAATTFNVTTPSLTKGTRAQVAEANAAILDAAVADGWEKVYADHVAQFSELMGRVSLQLGDAASTLMTNKLVDYYATSTNRTKADGLFLEQLYFQYGRYLEISCNNVLINAPANLQGIWNNDSNTSFWHCDIHTDVNVQMNYWPAEVTNLSTMHLPFLNNIISLAGDNYNFHTVAQRYKSGARGWMVPTETNIFGGTSQWMAFKIKTLAAWNSSHLWQHYRYTLDRTFLRRALPAMLKAAQFLKDISTRATDGTYFVADEYSPEHGPSGHSTAFAQQNTAEVVRSVIEGAEILGDDSPISSANLTEMRNFWNVLDKGLHTETYNGKTCLKEWADLALNSQGDAAGHRHLSHLMALYPYSQVSAYATDTEGKKLYQAAVNSLLVRNATDVTGWSGGWKVNLFARALKGNDARSVFALMLKHSKSYVIAMSGQGGCYYNLWDAHSPFQIDGNFGFTSGVAEMLLQSYDGNIHLLPALPTAWKSGSIKGLKAIGDFTVDQEWAASKFVSARIINHQGQPLTLTVGLLPSGMMVAATVNGIEVQVTINEDGSFTIPTSAPGDVIELTPVKIPDAIGEITTGTAAKANPTIYDLSGRRVAEAKRPGIYVKAGQKMAVR